MSRVKPVAVLLFALATLAAGCSKPVLEIGEPSAEYRDSAQDVINTSTVAPARNVEYADLASTADRVVWPVRKASYEVCMELALPVEDCEQVLIAEVTVFPDRTDPNAYADMEGNVGLHGGIIHISGSDAEIAAVVAHEFAHVMYGHVDKKMNNALVGAVIGGGIAAVLASDSGQYYDPQTTEDLINIGYTVGSTAYSPEMEIEADRTAIYILQRAGYPPSAMSDTIVRLSREDTLRRRNGQPTVGFLQTHPSDNRRVAHILSAIEDAKTGVPLVIARN